MIDLYKEIDFSKEVEPDSELRVFLHQACKKVELQQSEHLRKIKKPQLDDELLNQFIISGIPVLKTENAQKFLNLFKNKLLGEKAIGQKNGLLSIIPGMENGVGNQTLFLTYRTPAQAKTAFNKLNNLKFDKNHTMQCINVGELRAINEEEEAEQQNSQFKIPTFTKSEDRVEFNLDQQFKDQFLVREGNHVYLNWLDHLDKSAKTALPTEFLALNYTINKTVFSPLGSYLAVCTNEGTHIFFGSSLRYKGLLRQVAPIDAKFSADQRYIVTFNGSQSKNRQNFILWAVEEQVKIRSYRAHINQTLEFFQFSDDGLNLAIIMQNDVTFFNLSNVQELKRQARAPEEQQHIVKAPHVQKVAWLKSRGWAIVMCYELDYSPVTVPATRIFLYNCEQKVEKKWRAWGEHAKNGEIYVSERGEWVAIALKKFVKKGHFATAIQIGNLLKKEEGLQISSIEFKEDVGNISWDGINNRIAVICKDQSVKTINLRFNASFYEITTKNRSLQINKIGEINNNLQNRVVLASNGIYFALYNTSDDSAEKGRFSLGLITRENKDKGKRVFNFEFTKQNLMVNGMNFFLVDQSGRFALLGTEKGYQIWNFIGEIVTKDTLQKNINDVQWRPRTFNKLSEEEERTLIEQQKEIRKKYERIDDKRINALKYEKEEAKKKQKIQFIQFIQRKNLWFKGYSQTREKYLGFKQFEARTDKYEVDEGFIDLQ